MFSADQEFDADIVRHPLQRAKCIATDCTDAGPSPLLSAANRKFTGREIERQRAIARKIALLLKKNAVEG